MAVDEVLPVHVICGHRNKEDQDKAFKEGNSKLEFPNSKHNKKPSLAVDVVSGDGRSIDWADIKSFELVCLVIESKADELGIKVRLGRDFSFKDWPHIELV
jgi:peptidoglycan L-alanyl-D-glutamate endopeptidase CwlK